MSNEQKIVTTGGLEETPCWLKKRDATWAKIAYTLEVSLMVYNEEKSCYAQSQMALHAIGELVVKPIQLPDNVTIRWEQHADYEQVSIGPGRVRSVFRCETTLDDQFLMVSTCRAINGILFTPELKSFFSTLQLKFAKSVGTYEGHISVAV